MATMLMALPMEAMHIEMPIAVISNYCSNHLQRQLLIHSSNYSWKQLLQHLLIAAPSAAVTYSIYLKQQLLIAALPATVTCSSNYLYQQLFIAAVTYCSDYLQQHCLLQLVIVAITYSSNYLLAIAYRRTACRSYLQQQLIVLIGALHTALVPMATIPMTIPMATVHMVIT